MVFTWGIVARELSQNEVELEESAHQAKEEYGELVSKPLNGSFDINAEEEK